VLCGNARLGNATSNTTPETNDDLYRRAVRRWQDVDEFVVQFPGCSGDRLPLVVQASRPTAPQQLGGLEVAKKKAATVKKAAKKVAKKKATKKAKC